MKSQSWESLRALAEAAVLGVARRLSKPDRVSNQTGSLRAEVIVLVSNADEEVRVAKGTLERALCRLGWAEAEVGGLIAVGLATVVIVRRRRGRKVMLGERGYFLELREPEPSNEMFLALRLIWCASQCRAFHDARDQGLSAVDWRAVEIGAVALQKDFASQQSNGHEWLEYLAQYSPEHSR